MGFYFQNALDAEKLNPAQREQFDTLKSAPEEKLPHALAKRLEAIEDFIGSVRFGEAEAGYVELREDAFAGWIVAGGDSKKVRWVEME